MDKLKRFFSVVGTALKIPQVKKLAVVGIVAGSAVIGVNVAPDTVGQVLDASSAIIQVVGE